MSFKDEHLQQAIKNAPDQDLRASMEAREAVHAYAVKAIVEKKNISRFKLSVLWQKMADLPLVGMSSAMVALLVLVVFWGQKPEQSPFQGAVTSAVPDSATTSAPTPMASNAPAPALPDKANAMANGATNVEQVVPMRAEIAKQDSTPIALAKKEATIRLEPESQAPAAPSVLSEAAKPNVVESIADKAEIMASAPSEGRLAKAKVLAPSTIDSKDSAPSASPTLSTEQLESTSTLEQARARGATKAAKDIQAGVLKILRFDTPNQASESADAGTGYPIEFIQNKPTEALQAEVAAYNQAMRDWHKQTQLQK